MASERSEFYKPINLEDVDTAIYDWFNRIVDAHVETPTAERHKVPVVFGSNERWITAKESKGIRDKNGKLILPIMSIRRTGFDPVNTKTALATNVPRLTLSRKVSSKTNLIKNALAERPLSLQSVNESTVYEITTIPFPSNGTASYELVVHAQYIKQMNAILEKIMASLEYYETPQFVAMVKDGKLTGTGNERTQELEPTSEAPYEKRKLLDGYYFVGFFDGGMSDTGNIDEFTDEERIIRYSTTFNVPAYLHLDPEGQPPAVRVEKTAFKVKFPSDEAHFVDDPLELELIFGNGKIEER